MQINDQQLICITQQEMVANWILILQKTPMRSINPRLISHMDSSICFLTESIKEYFQQQTLFTLKDFVSNLQEEYDIEINDGPGPVSIPLDMNFEMRRRTNMEPEIPNAEDFFSVELIQLIDSSNQPSDVENLKNVLSNSEDIATRFYPQLNTIFNNIEDILKIWESGWNKLDNDFRENCIEIISNITNQYEVMLQLQNQATEKIELLDEAVEDLNAIFTDNYKD